MAHAPGCPSSTCRAAAFHLPPMCHTFSPSLPFGSLSTFMAPCWPSICTPSLLLPQGPGWHALSLHKEEVEAQIWACPALGDAAQCQRRHRAHEADMLVLLFFFFGMGPLLDWVLNFGLFLFKNLKIQFIYYFLSLKEDPKLPWCWERLRAGGEGGDRGWDGWMASPIQWTWIWASSRRWWRTGKPDMLPMGSQRVRHNWTTSCLRPQISIHSGQATWS